MEAFAVDELVSVDSHEAKLSSALRRTFEIGAICNNAFRNEEGLTVGQATDVALLNAALAFGVAEQKTVRRAVYARVPEFLQSSCRPSSGRRRSRSTLSRSTCPCQAAHRRTRARYRT